MACIKKDQNFCMEWSQLYKAIIITMLMTQGFIFKGFEEILQNIMTLLFRYWVWGYFVTFGGEGSTFFYFTQLYIFIVQGRKWTFCLFLNKCLELRMQEDGSQMEGF